MGIAKRIELVANCGIIVASCLLGAVITRELFPPPRSIPTIGVGEKLAISGVNWKNNGRSLIIVLQRGCHFCSDSATFYKRVIAEADRNQDTHVLAILPQNLKDARAYLDGLGLNIGDLHHAELSSLKIPGTPTLMLVNDTGIVTRRWFGRLPPAKETEVLESLRK